MARKSPGFGLQQALVPVHRLVSTPSGGLIAFRSHTVTDISKFDIRDCAERHAEYYDYRMHCGDCDVDIFAIAEMTFQELLNMAGEHTGVCPGPKHTVLCTGCGEHRFYIKDCTPQELIGMVQKHTGTCTGLIPRTAI